LPAKPTKAVYFAYHSSERERERERETDRQTDRQKIHAQFVNKVQGDRPIRIHLVWSDMTLLNVKGK